MGFTPQLSGLPARPGLRQAERGGVLPCVAQPLSGDALAAWATSITQPGDGPTPKEWAPGLVRASSGRAGLRTPPLPDDAFAPWSVFNRADWRWAGPPKTGFLPDPGFARHPPLRRSALARRRPRRLSSLRRRRPAMGRTPWHTSELRGRRGLRPPGISSALPCVARALA